MNPIYLMLTVGISALGIAGLIKIFSGAFLVGIGSCWVIHMWNNWWLVDEWRKMAVTSNPLN
jgi:hypothetical protein